MDRQPMQIAQGGIAGSEIIEAEPQTKSFEAVEHEDRSLRVLDGAAFGDLQLYQPGLDPRFVENCADTLDDVALRELARRQVDADLGSVITPEFPLPSERLAAGLAQHPKAERNDEASVFGDGYEIARREKTFLRMLPAYERLEAGQRLVGQCNDRLIVQDELTAEQPLSHIVFYVQPRFGEGVHVRPIDFDARLPEVLGLEHRKVGVTQQVFSFGIAEPAERHADAGGAIDFLSVDKE